MKPIVAKQLEPDLMLYDPELDSVHVLNPAAQMIYSMHQQGLGVEEMATALRGRFAVPPGQALAEDIHQAIQEMTSRGLL
jgi:hypothetical protein